MISNQKMKGIVKAEKIDNDGMNEDMRHELDVMENDGIKPKLDLEVEFDKDGMNEEMRHGINSPLRINVMENVDTELEIIITFLANVLFSFSFFWPI